MKLNTYKIFIVVLTLICFKTASIAQSTLTFDRFRDFSDHVTHVFKDNHPDLSFFKYRVISNPYNIFDYYKGETTDTVCDVIKYLSLVNDLAVSNYNDSNATINLPYIIEKMIEYGVEFITPVSLALIEYSDFKDSVAILNCIGFQNDQFTENCPSGFYPFKKDVLFASSALNQVFYYSPINFLLNDSLILSNIAGTIDSIFIDFDDGNGFIPVIKNDIYQISYTSEGSKEIKVKIKADTLFYNSSFNIIDSSGSGSKMFISSSIDLPDDGPNMITHGSLTGKYAVWYSPCNNTGKIRKPYIISAGANPGNGKQLVSNNLPAQLNMVLNLVTINMPFGGWNGDWRGTYYETYNGVYNKRFSTDETEGENNDCEYLDRLRDEGYDVIIVSYDNGTDFMANNAELFIEVIEIVNNEKRTNLTAENNYQGYHFENIVSGYSAGGLSTKLALALMESRYKAGAGNHPHTKTWVSIETENQGANVPLGMQYLIDFQANPGHRVISLNPLQTAADFVNIISAGIAQSFINNPSSYELTNYTSRYPNGLTPHRINLLNTFATIPGNTSNGYPEFCRRIGVAQGSGIGTRTGHTYPEIFDSKLKSGLSGGSFIVQPIPCGSNYTFYLPSTEKRTTARWWGSINLSGNIFDGKVTINSRFTWFPKTCILFFGCHCIGPFEIGSNIIIGEKHVAKPTVENNYDDTPASSQSMHIEVYESSAYPFYNNWFAGNAFARPDPSLHAFATTVSTLDLRNPSTGDPVDNFTSPVSLGLMNIKPLSLPFPEEPNLRHGFPYIANPFDHYQITPYDAVFAIGINNVDVNGNPKPDNQFHVEDPQIALGNYLARVEVAPENLFLSNRDLSVTQSDYIAEFEARNKIFIGNTDQTGLNSIYSLDPNFDKNYLTPDGNFVVGQESKLILRAGDEIAFLPGFEVVLGAEIEVHAPEPYNCPNLLFKTANNYNSGEPESSVDEYFELVNSAHSEKEAVIKEEPISAGVRIYPNPNNGTLIIEKESEERSEVRIYNLTGKLMFSTLIAGANRNTINLQRLENGIYFLEVITGDTSEKFKIIIAK